MIRRAKSDYTHERHKARTLILIADSASENKNNVLFAYCTDLVENGWYDSVELLFGPVGHTHNGVDSTHKIHNQNVAGQVSGDLGHFVFNYVKGFSGKESHIPDVSLLERTVDWIAYYTPHMRPISGFTKTKNDPTAVRGFKISRRELDVVDLQWKIDPASELEWRGQGGYPNTTGFFMMKSKPEGLPTFVETLVVSAESKETAKKLRSEAMRNALRAQDLLECVEWNYAAATEDHIPVHEYLEEHAPNHEWGRLCKIGAVEGKRGKVRLLRDYWDAAMGTHRKVLWTLPTGPQQEHIAATTNIHHFSGDQALLNQRPLAAVRYRGEKRGACEVARHSNNIDGGWRQEGHNSTTEEKDPDYPQNATRFSRQEEQPDSDTTGSPEQRGQPAAPGADNMDAQEPHQDWYFEEDFQLCKENMFAVGLAKTTVGPSPYIYVGQIVAANKEARTFEMKPLQPEKNPWKQEAVAGKWHPKRVARNTPLITQPHFCVLQYFMRMNKSNTLPKIVQDKINERNIQWCKE